MEPDKLLLFRGVFILDLFVDHYYFFAYKGFEDMIEVPDFQDTPCQRVSKRIPLIKGCDQIKLFVGESMVGFVYVEIRMQLYF